MATYSHHGSSEIQGAGDSLQTLILMSPAYVGYSETQPQAPSSASNLVFLNSNSSGNSTLNHSHHPPSATQYLAGIPLRQLHGSAPASAASFQDSQNQDVSELHGLLPQLQYSLQNPIGAARDATRSQRGLSLSLSSQQPPGYGSVGRDREDPSQPLVTAKLPPGGEDVRVSRGSHSRTSNSMNCSQSELSTAKYLKAAQELLDEVVNVGKGAKSATKLAKEEHGQPQNTGESSGAADGGEQSGAEAVPDRGAELTAAEKQEIQMKKAKLVNMLDEVEQQYWQYRHQMQIVISWFDQAAGIGSAKTYTALALQTISKQFRCLKDAIMGQIQAACKNLGEEDGLGGKTEGSRLKYVDNEIRQQGGLQQLGMIQQSTWRSQRGLPERSVSVLRAWLFSHFLHPYPKDSDKVMLAKQTGLSRSQVSNWFINARVRLWKPMIEEMHAEEMKEVEGKGSEDERSGLNEVPAYKSPTPESNGPAGTKNQDKSFVLKQDSPINHNIAPVTTMSTSSTSPDGETMRKFSLIGPSGMESITQGSPKKQCNAGTLHSPSIIPSMNIESQPTINFDKSHMSMKFGNQRLGRDGFTLMGAPTDFIGGFSSYPVVKLGRFGAEQYRTPYSGNHVSLTLGLQHEENLSMSRANQTFLPNQNIQLGRGVQIGEANEFSGMNTPTSTHSTSVYENINIQNPKRFDTQLLPDFVA